MRWRNPRGTILLEALVGLLLLSAAAVTIVGAITGGLANEGRLHDRERQTERADRLLAGLTLLSRRDLDRRIGASPAGEFVVVVTRPEPTLYRMTISPDAAPDVELLTTVVYRADESR